MALKFPDPFALETDIVALVDAFKGLTDEAQADPKVVAFVAAARKVAGDLGYTF